jgi:hypothetical protein
LLDKKDKRMKLSTEIFGSIKYVKVNALEEKFYHKIDEKRQEELGVLKKRQFLSQLFVFSFWSTPMFVINATFAYYILSGNDLDTKTAFTIISLF